MEPQLIGTHIERVTIPAHILLLTFLDAKIIDKVFESEQELRDTLDTWQDFAIAGGFDIVTNAKDWGELVILDKSIVVDSNSIGGPLRIGNVVRS